MGEQEEAEHRKSGTQIQRYAQFAQFLHRQGAKAPKRQKALEKMQRVKNRASTLSHDFFSSVPQHGKRHR